MHLLDCQQNQQSQRNLKVFQTQANIQPSWSRYKCPTIWVLQFSFLCSIYLKMMFYLQHKGGVAKLPSLFFNLSQFFQQKMSTPPRVEMNRPWQRWKPHQFAFRQYAPLKGHNRDCENHENTSETVFSFNVFSIAGCKIMDPDWWRWMYFLKNRGGDFPACYVFVYQEETNSLLVFPAFGGCETWARNPVVFGAVT